MNKSSSTHTNIGNEEIITELNVKFKKCVINWQSTRERKKIQNHTKRTLQTIQYKIYNTNLTIQNIQYRSYPIHYMLRWLYTQYNYYQATLCYCVYT